MGGVALMIGADDEMMAGTVRSHMREVFESLGRSC